MPSISINGTIDGPDPWPTATSSHGSRGASILGTNSFFITCVTVLITLRVYSRVFVAKKLFIDDYLMITAAVFFLIQAAINIHAVSVGFGQHQWDLASDIQQTATVLQYNFLSLIFVSLAVTLGKLSIIGTLLHIFTEQTANIILRAVLRITGLFVSLLCAAQTLLIIFQCKPVHLSWAVSELDDKGGSCINLEKVLLSTCVINVITDFIICCSPIPSFFELNMPLRKKAALSALFLSGLLASVIAIVRVVFTHGLEGNKDRTYVTAPYFNWSVAEAGLCIITGSMPALRPLLARFLPKLYEKEALDNFAVSIKSGIRRARSASLGQSSRRRSTSTDLGHMRTLSAIPECKGLESAGKSHRSTDSIDSIEEGPSKLASALRLTPDSRCVKAFVKVKKTCSNLVARLLGAEEARRGRSRSRLSVINELEIAEERGRDQDLGGRRIPLLLQSMAYSVNAINTSALRAATEGRIKRWLGRDSPKPFDSVALGSIVVIKEVRIT